MWTFVTKFTIVIVFFRPAKTSKLRENAALGKILVISYGHFGPSR